MLDGVAVGKVRARLSEVLDDLEFHRAFDIQARLEGAIRVREEARRARATDLEMRARLVEADMRLRVGSAADAARLATKVNHWAREHGPVSLRARSHLILSSVFESVGDYGACLDHALRGLELLDDDTPARVRGNFLVRLADSLSVAGSYEAARERYGKAEQIFVAIGDTERRISVLNNLACTENEAAEPRRCWEVARAMRDLAEESGLQMSAPLLDTLARAHIGIGEYEQAEAVLEHALEVLIDCGDVEADTSAGMMLTLAEVQLRRGRLDLAQATLDDCLGTCEERNLGSIRLDALRVQAELHAAAGRYSQAFEGHKVFHTEFVKLNSARREADARTRQALFETAEARHSAERFWRQARTDALTGLPNRRYVDEEVPRCLAQVEDGASLVVAIVDADHFKRVNDTLSHEVGDRVIRELSLVLQEYLMAWPDPSRSGSRLVARLGGEEFLVILPGLDLAAAGTLLTGMRNQVALHEWDPLVGKLSLTVSVGATSAEPGDTQAILLGRADRNLYLAKAGGRNRVVVAPSAVRRSSAVQNGRSSAEGSIQARPLSRTMPALKIEADPRTSRASKLGRRPGRTVGESVIPER